MPTFSGPKWCPVNMKREVRPLAQSAAPAEGWPCHEDAYDSRLPFALKEGIGARLEGA